MNPNDPSFYTGCPVQHVRQFIAGKWQIGILWYLKDAAMGFNALQSLLPGISAKVLMQELDFFVQKGIVDRNTVDVLAPRSEYTLSPMGRSLVPVLNTIVEWGYAHLQDEQVSRDMCLTPLPTIRAIENRLTGHN